MSYTSTRLVGLGSLFTFSLMAAIWHALSLVSPSSELRAEEPRRQLAGPAEAKALGEGEIFADGFETSDTSQWTATVRPVYARFLLPSEGATQETEPEIEVQVWTPTGIGVDFSSFELESNSAPLPATCEWFVGTINHGGHFECLVDEPFADGQHVLTARVDDLDGTTSADGLRVIVVDTTLPAITIDSPADGTVTSATSVEIEGSVSEEADLMIDHVPVDLAPDLTFHTLPMALDEGDNPFLLTAEDAAGNLGTESLVVTRDTVAPDMVDIGLVTIEEDGGQLQLVGGPGAAEPGATLRIENLTTGLVIEIVVGVDGSFSTGILGQLGDTLRFEALDAADNVSPWADLPTPWALPPDPATVAPPHDPTVPLDWHQSLEFLYTSDPPIQVGVDLEAVEAHRITWLRGRVVDRDGAPLAGARITIDGQESMGHTLTRADGWFDLVGNGGDRVLLDIDRPGYLPVQRQIHAPWRDARTLDDIVMTRLDPVATTILGNAPGFQVAESSQQDDEDGPRQATLLFQPGTEAELIFGDGSAELLDLWTVRATEYTVGDDGPAAMPGELPLAVGYTYAVELSTDEAMRAGALHIEFTLPVFLYVDNFIGFPTGEWVPAGWYDRTEGRWKPSDNGRVIEVLGVDAGGLAVLDVDGSGLPASPEALEDLGITPAEQVIIASRWPTGASMWRVPVRHFTPWDCNWPYGPPEDAEPPEPDPEPDEPDVDDLPPTPDDSDPDGVDDTGGADEDGDGECDEGEDCVPPEEDTTPEESCDSQVSGSIIGCESQTLRQMRPITGTPYRLTYASQRSEGFEVPTTLRIPVTGRNPLPPSVEAVILEVEIAGRKWVERYPVENNLVWHHDWDQRDAWARRISGATPVSYRRGYAYSLTYYPSSRQFREAWAQVADSTFSPRPRRRSSEIILWRDEVRRFDEMVRPTVGGLDNQGFGLGGWNVDVHHVYDPARRTLYRGDGTQRVAWQLGSIFELTAGVGIRGDSGDGGGAKAAEFSEPGDIAIGPDGSLYIADRDNYRIRKIGRDGIVRTVVGTGEPCAEVPDHVEAEKGDLPCAEGQPPLAARIGEVGGLDIDRHGRLYFTDLDQACAFRLQGGVLQRLAGECIVPEGPPPSVTDADKGLPFPVDPLDRIPALDAVLDEPGDIAVADDGSFYLSDGNGLNFIATDGMLSPVFLSSDADSFFSEITHLALAPDGSLLVSTQEYIHRLSASGNWQVIAGNGSPGVSADGVPAVGSPIDRPRGVVATADGTVYFAERGSYRIRSIGTDGILRTKAGKGMLGSTAVGAPVRSVAMRSPNGLALAQDGSLHMSDQVQHRVYETRGIYDAYDDDGYRIAEANGSVVYEFDAQGRHQRTVHGLTGATVFSFGYDPAGLLATITDGDGLETTITRSTTEQGGGEIRIKSPFGQETELELGPFGFLANITNPADEAYNFDYLLSSGLMVSATDPRGGEKEYDYDDMGRLVVARDEGDGEQRFLRFSKNRGQDYTVTRTTAEGAKHQYTTQRWFSTGERRVQRMANGEAVETNSNNGEGSARTLMPSDMVVRTQRAPDPRFGMQAGYTGEAVTYMPSGLTSNVTSTQSASYASVDDPTSLEWMTSATTVNGRTFSSTFDAAAKTITSTSAENRQATVEVDAQGRTTRVESPQLEPLAIAYRAAGTVESLTMGEGAGSRTTTFAYDALERLDTVTDPLSRTVSFDYDAANRVTQTTLPDGETVSFSYDGKGNVTSVTPPGRPAHVFTYTPTNLPETYVLPDAGAGSATETRTYDRDQRLTGIVRADGRTLAFAYDPAEHHLASITSPRGVTSFVYQEPTDQLVAIIEPGGEQLDFAWDGPLLTSATWTGTVNGSVEWTYDTSFRPQTVSVNGANAIAYGYDQDSLVTSAGALSITRETDTGRESTTTLGDVTTTRTYTPFGEPDIFTVSYDGNVIYAENLDYDARGWITDIQRTQNGGTFDWSFGHDLRGRLETVEIDGTPESTYGYDANSNRISYDGQFGTVLPADVTVDARDRLLAYDDLTFTYTDAGELLTKTQNGQTVSYNYDVFGNLRTVDLPSGIEIEYVTDGANRRIGKKIDGTLVQGFLYQDALNPIAELDGAGNVVSRFVYATRSSVPDYLVKEGVTYRIVADHLGSVRLVVDVDTGVIAQEMRYDEFGRVTLDTSPGFQPFGFAGGLYDSQTGLVRFGARDYDPELGRWTAADPSGFVGSSSNLYVYSETDPINSRDAGGLTDESFVSEFLEEIAPNLPEIPQAVTDACAGFGDALLLGFGDDLRNFITPDSSVNPQSGAYVGGEIAGTVAGIAAGAGGVVKAAPGVFAKGSWLNSGQHFRIGFGRDGGRRVFRIGGDWVGKKIDLWKGGPL